MTVSLIGLICGRRWRRRHWPKASATAARVTCLLGLACAAHAATITVSDGDFLNANWLLNNHDAGNGGGGSVVANQVLSGGIPGLYRDVFDNVIQASTQDSLVLGAHFYTPFTYDPSTMGAINTVSLSFFVKCIEVNDKQTNCSGSVQNTGTALQQGGVDYILDPNFWLLAGGDWNMLSFPAFHQNDFDKVFVQTLTGDQFVDKTVHPNFSSSGGPIEFGFFNANSTNGFGYHDDVGYDNWFLTLDTSGPSAAPEPGTLVVVGSALIGLGLRLRRRK